MTNVKYIDIKEFRERGYLQEANRWFFHPLGLALEVTTHEDGTESLSGVWDYRDDPEGIIYSVDYGPDEEKAAYIFREWNQRAENRQRLLGFMVQPIESE